MTRPGWCCRKGAAVTKAKRERARWLKVAAEYQRGLKRLDELEGPARAELAYTLLGTGQALVLVAQGIIAKGT